MKGYREIELEGSNVAFFGGSKECGKCQGLAVEPFDA